jgi:hypothetical protein
MALKRQPHRFVAAITLGSFLLVACGSNATPATGVPDAAVEPSIVERPPDDSGALELEDFEAMELEAFSADLALDATYERNPVTGISTVSAVVSVVDKPEARAVFLELRAPLNTVVEAFPGGCTNTPDQVVCMSEPGLSTQLNDGPLRHQFVVAAQSGASITLTVTSQANGFDTEPDPTNNVVELVLN